MVWNVTTHTTGGEVGHVLAKAHSSHANHTVHVSGVVERSVVGTIVANGRHHHDAVGGGFEHLFKETPR
jgi:hypothetical protein